MTVAAGGEDMPSRAASGVAIGLGMVLGVLAVGLVRLAWLPPEPTTHYHANVAVFVDGARLDLSAERYMEDVARCKADPTRVAPEERVHLHNRNPDVVHVHDGGATWGHLLANLGFGFGDTYLVTDRGERYFTAPPGAPPVGARRALKFVLNGAPVASAANVAIRSADRLLISYGPETPAEVTRTQFPRVAATGAAFNRLADPAGCGGATTASVWERVRRAFWM